METRKKVFPKKYDGENFNNKELLIQKVEKKETILKWLALFGAFLFQAIPYGVANNILGNMQPFVVNGVAGENGYSGIFNGFILFTLVFTFGSLFSAMFTPLIGKLFGRINLKVLLGIGCVISGGAFAMIGLLGVLFNYGTTNPTDSIYAQRAAWLYTWYGICLIGSSIFSGLGVPFIVGSWFPGKNRGTMLGIAFAGGSAGNLIWQIAINQTLKTITVWNAFYIYGAVAIIAGILICIFLINTPRIFKINQSTQNLNLNQAQTKEQDIENNGAGIRTTLEIPWFYVLCLSYGIFALAIAGVASQWPTFLKSGLADVAIKHAGSKDSNILQTYFANVSTIVGLVYGIACLLGNLTGGYIFSKFGVAKAFIMGGILRSIGSVMMLLGVFNPMLIAIGVGMSGFTCYTYTSATGFMSTNLFGRKDSSVVIGLLGLAFAIGFSISTPLISGIQGNVNLTSSFAGIKMNGNWLGVWIFTSVIALVGSLVVALSASKIKRMGYLGMANANYSRYGFLVLKFSIPTLIKALKIWTTGKDCRLTETYLKLFNQKVTAWNQKNNKLIDKENIKYQKIISKFNLNIQHKEQSLNQKVNKIQDKIQNLKLNEQEQNKINLNIQKLNLKIQNQKDKISECYNCLIQKLINKNEKNIFNSLINRLKNNEIMKLSDYENSYVIEYFVKYASFIWTIQRIESKIEIVKNPKLYYLTNQKNKIVKQQQILENNKNHKLQELLKIHNQMLNYYEYKYQTINKIIDNKISSFENYQTTKYQNKINKFQNKISKNKTQLKNVQKRYEIINKTWNENSIHETIIKDSKI